MVVLHESWRLDWWPMNLASASMTAPAPSRAAQYVRISTEHQQYSPENQLEIIRQYAAAHNMEIVQEYSDHGRSGLNIAGREGLNQLKADVEAKRTNFTSLLVYDVSRWGRYQDVDDLVCGQGPIAGHSPKRREMFP